MNDAVLQQLHEVQLEILDEVVRIFEKHGLTYYMSGGTLLGAVRHKGFIPWDDDVDFLMPRADYERFIDLCATELDKKYSLNSYRTTPGYARMYLKVQKDGTLFLEEQKYAKDLTREGIFIDIFPLDDAKKTTGFQSFQKNMVNRILAALRVKEDGWKPGPVTFIMAHLFSGQQLIAMMHKVVQLKNGKGYGYFVNFGSPYGVVKHTIPKSLYNPPSRLPFEGRELNGIGDYDNYFRRMFGDNYMTPPPPEKRAAHKLVRLSFDTTGPDAEM